ncbi:MAG: VCBS repeat-containing protein [Planctomycetes bacterium]|nr:VCBS repeat-containing protein [Planctomycetota bacterium]
MDPARTNKGNSFAGREDVRESSTPTEEDIADAVKRMDAGLDGWGTETFEVAARGQLAQLGKLIASVDSIDKMAIQRLATSEFASGPLRPNGLQPCFSDPCLTVYRSVSGQANARTERSLVDALRQLAEPFQGTSDVRVKFKIFNVVPGESLVTTVSYYQATGRGVKGTVQQSATWHCSWTPLSDGTAPRLVSIQVKDFEEVVSRNSQTGLFVDCTSSVLGANLSYRQQMLQGIDYWRQRLPRWMVVHYTGHHGLTIGDVNGDGLDDVYICRPGGLPNRLFVQTETGTARDVSREAGVDWLDYSVSALLIDLDNDGDQDLAIAAGWGVILMSNDGSGRFSKEATIPVFAGMNGMSAADYDLDGDLDLYVCGDGDQDQAPVPYHDANNGGRNFLLRNNGDWQFEDVTEQAGLDTNNRRYSFAAAWEDYDGDGDMDLYVANDYGRNNLYQNDKGHFTDVAARAGVEDIAAGMSVDWADYKGDGRMDLYVSNMFSSAGNRVTYQRQFKTGVSEKMRSQYRRHARGNSLFENIGNGMFRDVSVETGVTMGRWAWGSNFLDVNNDGLEDIFVANGYITQEDSEDL